MEDEHDYSRVVLPGASDEEDEDIYKIPRNVVSCFIQLVHVIARVSVTEHDCMAALIELL